MRQNAFVGGNPSYKITGREKGVEGLARTRKHEKLAHCQPLYRPGSGNQTRRGEPSLSQKSL